MKVSIQQQDFNVQAELELLRVHDSASSPGAIVTFTGLVRDFDSDAQVTSLFLEHYPGMTEKSLEEISSEAAQRWAIIDSVIIHRIGLLEANEQIVFVGVSSKHRHDAFAA
ncbi:molybdenum cofactor biosynthesis protein MoaE, partial [Gammaproteobacteria bacterium]|nr:molybdenum cofactor biosynthesis protein MoaE [Gammaproteobacteria bacterium]